MQVDNPLRLIRELKGAPLSIVLALSIVRQRVSQEWLERMTGYTDKPVSQALAYLQEIGMVDHARSGWQLTGQAWQLPLGLDLDQSRQGVALDDGTRISADNTDQESGIRNCEENVCAQTVPVGGEDSEVTSEADGSLPPNAGGIFGAKISPSSRNISDSLIIITTDSLNTEGGNNNNNNGGGGRNFSESPPVPAGGSGRSSPGVGVNPDLFEQNLAALGAARVVGAKRQELARLGHVTPAYVRAWEMQLKHELGKKYRPGILIRTIESGAPAPPLNENGHLQECDCMECRRYGFIRENRKFRDENICPECGNDWDDCECEGFNPDAGIETGPEDDE